MSLRRVQWWSQRHRGHEVRVGLLSGWRTRLCALLLIFFFPFHLGHALLLCSSIFFSFPTLLLKCTPISRLRRNEITSCFCLAVLIATHFNFFCVYARCLHLWESVTNTTVICSSNTMCMLHVYSSGQCCILYSC